MALGFQDCCNSSSYFFLNGIPATVSQNEFYHIITLEGPAFCATYTNIPALNYLPPTYTLIEMTEYVSCDTCFAGAPLTCPAQETIFLSQFGPGSISVGTDCSIRTLFPMIVECISTNPTFDGFADGVVRLFVTGGTPPYSFFNLTDNTVFGGALPVVNSTYTLIDGALEGEYPIRVVDAQSDYNITVNCVLESPPTVLTLVANANSVSIADACDGTIVAGISNGTPPYQLFVNGAPSNVITIVDLCAGDYDLTVIDSGVGTDQQITSTIVTVGTPNSIVYPDDICLTFIFCNTTFNLTFSRQGTYNFRANYVCDNPEDLGLTQFILRWEAGWTTTQETSNGNLNFTAPCAIPLPSNLIQFVKSSSQTEQPTGSWQSNLGMFQGISGNMAQGACVPADPGGGGGGPVIPPVLTFTTTNAQCALALGQVILEGSGGAGAPYTYVVNGITQVSSTITLPAGNYTATVLDADSVSSSGVNFTIGFGSGTNTIMSMFTAVDTANPFFNETTSFQGGGIGTRYTSYHPVKTTISVLGLPQFVPVQGYFIVTVKKQSLFSDIYEAAAQQTANTEIVFDLMPIPQIEDQSGSLISYPTYSWANFTSTTGVRPNGINPNLLPDSASLGCVAPDNTYRTTTRVLTIGSVAEPVEIFNDTRLSFYVAIDNAFKPQVQASPCEPAVGVQIEVNFVRTSGNIVCYNFSFPQNIRSARQLNTTDYLPLIYTNTTIIN
jgi:hypothetical protein